MAQSVWRDVGEALLDLLLPPRCGVCEAYGPALCADCRATIIPFGSGDEPIPMHISDIASAGMHREALQTAVQRLKYAQRVSLAAPLGGLLSGLLAERDWQPTLVVPVPMHWWRRTLRGYNQAELLAEELARQAGVSHAPNAIRCVKAVASQVGQPRAVRVRNVRDAFVLTDAERVHAQRVLLLDDVWTTGSTLAECTRVLRLGGAAEVFALTVTHAPPPGSAP